MIRFDFEIDRSLVTVTDAFDTMVSSMYLGPEERKPISGPKRGWNLRFQKDHYDADEIWDFYVARRGTFEAFEFICPIDGKPYAVKFAEDSLSRTVFWRMMYEFGLRLVEVYPHEGS